MKDELITFKTAKLAKEKGFDWECTNGRYLLEGKLKGRIGASVDCKEYAKAPTQSLLQRWLREEHSLNIETVCTTYHIGGLDSIKKWTCYLGWSTMEESIGEDLTYELALEAGLIEALKLI